MPIDQKYIDKFNFLWNKKCKDYPKLPSILPAARRIIVIGDIHGDLDELIRCLILSGCINNNHQWIGNDTIIV